MPLTGRRPSVTETRLARRLDALQAAIAALPRRPDRAQLDQIEALSELAAKHPESPAVQRALGAAIASPRWLDHLDVDELHAVELLLGADLAAGT